VLIFTFKLKFDLISLNKMSSMRNCSMYIDYDIEKAPKSHELMKLLKSNNLKTVIKAVKTLILCIIHNVNYPRMLMLVFNFVVPK